MALSGTIYGSFSAMSTDKARPYITWSASQNVTNNTSSVTATLNFVRYDGYRSWNNTAQSMSITINGTTTSGSYAFDMPGSGAVDTIFSATTSVTHNDDGTKSITISASGSTGLSNLGSFSVSGTVTLDTIPRASGFTAFTLSNSVLNKDTAVTVNYTLDRKSSSFSQDMTLKLGGKVIKSWNTTSTGSLTQALTTTEVNTIITSTTSSTSGTLTLVMQTKSGTSNIGSSSSRTASFTLNAAIKPTATSLTVSISGSGRDKTISKYVQSITKPTASFTATAGYGATTTSNIINIKRQSDNGNSQSITSNSGTVANAVSLSGVYLVTATTTDSRGMTATATTTFTVDAYSQPSITTFTANRTTPTTTVSNVIAVTWSIGASNPTTIVVKGVNNVGTSVDLYTLSANTAGTLSTTRTYTSQSDASSYTYTITATDSFGAVSTASVKIGTTFVEMTIAKGKGVGIGKVWEYGTLDVGGVIQGRDELRLRRATGGASIRLVQEDSDLGFYNYIAFADAAAAWKAYVGFGSSRDGHMYMYNTLGNVVLRATQSTNFVQVDTSYVAGNTGLKVFNKTQLFGNGGDTLELWGQDHGYIEFFIKGGSDYSGTARSGYIGWGTPGNTNLYIQNELGGPIVLGPNAGTGTAVFLFDKATNGGINYGGSKLKFLASTGGLQARNDLDTTYLSMAASAFPVNSERKVKTNIEVDTDSALEKINNTTVYNYHLKNDLNEWGEDGGDVIVKNQRDPNTVKKRKGLILDEAPEEIIDGDGIELYAMSSTLWKAVQELSSKVDYLEKKSKK